MSELEVTFALREEAEGDGLTIEGVAVPYNVPVKGPTKEYGNAVEYFAPGAFKDFDGKEVPLLDIHEGDPIGSVTLTDREDGLYFKGRLLSISAAKDFAERVKARLVRPSAEFAPGEIRRAVGTVTHLRVADIRAIAGTYKPAYATSASVRSITEGSMTTETMEEVTTPEGATVPAGKIEPAVSQAEMARIAQNIADEAIRKYASREAFGNSGPVDPFAEYRGKTLGELVQHAVQPDADRAERGVLQYAMRTIADIVTTAGANAGMVTPGVVGEIHGIVSRGRPAITAFGGPRPIPDVSGMSIDWPYFDGTLSALVGAQSAQKAEITSVAVDIKKGTEPLNTYAGGADIAYQLLRRASRNYIDAYVSILLAAWGIVTDAAFVTELESGSVTSDFAEALASVDATEFKNLLIDASIAVQTATGQPAQFALASTTAFTQFAKLLTPATSVPGLGGNTGIGGTDIRTLTVNVGGLPIIHTPSVTAGKIIVSNREAAAWYEDGPFVAQDEDVLHLGRDVALWSMGAGARFIPAGIIEMYDVTP